MIAVIPGLTIPESELEFKASRSGGPGGQNVNKVSSRVTLRFDLEHSPALTPEQRERIRRKLASRISNEGILQVTSQRTRSQDLNREDAVARFRELLRKALQREKRRIATSATASSRQARLAEKHKRTSIKEERSKGRNTRWQED